MFISIFGIQISIFGLIAIGLGIISMILLIKLQGMTWYIWSLWIGIACIWFANYWLFGDVASLIDTSISCGLAIYGLIEYFRKKKRKRGRHKN